MRNLPRWCCCRVGVVWWFGGFGGVWGVIWPNVCTYHKSICPSPVWVAGGEGRTPVGGELGVGGGSWNTGRPALQGWWCH